MLGIKRQPVARHAVGDPRMYAAQTPDRGKQPQHAALARTTEPRIGIGQRPHIAALDVGDDQHFGLGRVIER